MIDIAWLAQHGPCKKFKAGQTIPCPGGESANSERAMYILLGGKVDVTSAGKKPSPEITLFPGDVFGGEEYFTNSADYVYTASVDSVVYIITESSFQDLSWSQPDTVFAVLKAAYVPQGKPSVKPASAAGKESNTGTGNQVKQSGEPGSAGTGADSSQQFAAPIGMTEAIFPEGHKSYPGIIKPQYSNLVYEKEYTCPYCKKTFMDYKIFSSKLFEAAPIRYDLRRFYADFQTEWYEIITCRHCYFSTVHNYYTEARPLIKQKIENELNAIRASIFMDFDSERDIDFVFTAHYLALVCADGYLSYGNPLRAKIWGNLSWLYEDVEDKEMELFAAEKAASAYEEVFAGTMLSPTQEQATCMSIVGMQMRAGIDRDLKKYLYQVRTAKNGERTYITMAEDLMDKLKVSNE